MAEGFKAIRLAAARMAAHERAICADACLDYAAKNAAKADDLGYIKAEAARELYKIIKGLHR